MHATGVMSNERHESVRRRCQLITIWERPHSPGSPDMTRHDETVDHAILQRMQAAGIVTDALLVAEPEGWACVVQVRRTQCSLVAKRGGVRHWSKMESAARYLRQLGIAEFRVDARHMPETAVARAARPDARARLTHAHEAAAYDTWFREQVQAAIAEADAPDAVWYTHDEIETEFAERRRQLSEQIGPA